jgi:hypothetical protein
MPNSKTVKEVFNTKFHKQPFSGSRIITCGQTDVAFQTNILNSFRLQRTKNCSDDESKTLRSLNMFRLKNKTKLSHAMAEAVIRRPVTAATRFRSHDSPCEIVVDKVTLEKALLPVLRFFPVGIIPPLPRTHRPYHRLYLNLSQTLHRCSAHLTLHSQNQTFLVSRSCEVFTQQSTAVVSCCSV